MAQASASATVVPSTEEVKTVTNEPPLTVEEEEVEEGKEQNSEDEEEEPDSEDDDAMDGMDPSFSRYPVAVPKVGYVKTATTVTARNMTIYYLFTTLHDSNPDPKSWKGVGSVQADIRRRLAIPCGADITHVFRDILACQTTGWVYDGVKLGAVKPAEEVCTPVASS